MSNIMEEHHIAEIEPYIRQFAKLSTKDILPWMVKHFKGIGTEGRSYEEILNDIKPENIGLYNWDALENLNSGDPNRMLGGAVWLITRVMSPSVFQELGLPDFAKGILTRETLSVKGDTYRLIIPDHISCLSYINIADETPIDEITFLCSTQKLNTYYIFQGMESLRRIYIRGNIEEICGGIFEDCVNLETVMLPDTLKRIGSAAFAGCVKLRNIKLNDGLEFIGSCAFCNDESIEELVFPSNKITIAGDAFASCTGIKRAEINAPILEAPMGCFDDYIGTEEALGCLLVMDDCGRLESLSYRNVKNIVRFCDCDMPALKEVSICEGARAICAEAFSGSEALEEIVLPDGVEEIMDKAFADCPALKIITIPDSIRKIAPDAFKNSTNIQIGYKGETYSYSERDRMFSAMN